MKFKMHCSSCHSSCHVSSVWVIQ